MGIEEWDGDTWRIDFVRIRSALCCLGPRIRAGALTVTTRQNERRVGGVGEGQ